MEFKIEEIKDKKIWEEFLEKCEEKTFLQSFNWGEFQKMMGNKIWRLGIIQCSSPGDEHLKGFKRSSQKNWPKNWGIVRFSNYCHKR
jgi:hypothetical protein